MGQVNLMNAVFYSDTYHPIQAGSIDGTDILSHDNGVHRALLASTTGLYDPTSDPNIEGDPYCTIFVGRLSRMTSEEELKKSMEKYGDIKRLRIVRDIVTGASSGYAFVEFETERQMRRAYEGAYASTIDGNQVIVDYCRQRLMPGWIPRRLGGGLGGKKESGQLRFGGRDRPFRAPLRPIPHEELKKLGIPLPPEGHYLSRFELPPLPRRRSAVDYHDKARYSSRHKERSASFDNLQAEADLQDPNVASRSSRSRDDGGRRSYNRHEDREREDSKDDETRKSRKRHRDERERYHSSSRKHDHSYSSSKHSSRSRRSEDSDRYGHASQKSTDME